MSSKIDISKLVPYTTPEEALAQLEEADAMVTRLHLEIIDALRADIGYSVLERLRLHWQGRKYRRLGLRIHRALHSGANGLRP